MPSIAHGRWPMGDGRWAMGVRRLRRADSPFPPLSQPQSRRSPIAPAPRGASGWKRIWTKELGWVWPYQANHQNNPHTRRIMSPSTWISSYCKYLTQTHSRFVVATWRGRVLSIDQPICSGNIMHTCAPFKNQPSRTLTEVPMWGRLVGAPDR